MERWESPVERAIREAQERGEFDNLPGAGKPLPSLGSVDSDDPDWWVKGLLQREQLDLTGAVPPAIALRKERATFPESLLDLRTEEGVRAVLEDFNRRVRHDRLRPTVGPLPPILAPTVDVEEQVARWRELRAAADARARAATLAAKTDRTSHGESAQDAGRRTTTGWLRRLLGGGRA
jgi:hypothetical protein